MKIEVQFNELDYAILMRVFVTSAESMLKALDNTPDDKSIESNKRLLALATDTAISQRLSHKMQPLKDGKKHTLNLSDDEIDLFARLLENFGRSIKLTRKNKANDPEALRNLTLMSDAAIAMTQKFIDSI